MDHFISWKLTIINQRRVLLIRFKLILKKILEDFNIVSLYVQTRKSHKP